MFSQSLFPFVRLGVVTRGVLPRKGAYLYLVFFVAAPGLVGDRVCQTSMQKILGSEVPRSTAVPRLAFT